MFQFLLTIYNEIIAGHVPPGMNDMVLAAHDDSHNVAQTWRKNAIKLYYMGNHKIATMEELMEKDESGMAGLPDFSNMDPWGNPYEIREGDTASEWVVLSYGKDGSEGTDDDLRSDDKKNKDG